MVKIYFTLVLVFLLSGCGIKNPFARTTPVYTTDDSDVVYDSDEDYGYGEERSSEALRKSTMKPYCVRGKWYYPVAVEEGDTFTGKASWYGPDFHGHLTANGERYNMYARTAASKTLPINTYVKVTNLNNGKETVVRINDRGPFVENRIIDLSYKAAKEIGLIKKGVVPVRLEVISHNSDANKYATKRVEEKRYAVVKKQDTVKNKRSYFVQIATLREKKRALELRKKYNLLNRKYKPYVFAKNNIYKLVIGKFKTSSEAKRFISKNGFRGAFVVSN